MRLAVAAAALLLAATPALADLDARAQLGFGGRWIVEAATPLTLDLTNSGSEPVAVEIVISQGEGMMAADIIQRRVVEVPAGATRQELFVVPGAQIWSGGVEVELNVDPVVVIRSPTKSSDRGSLKFGAAGADGVYSGGQVAYAAKVVGVVGDARGTLAARIGALGLTTDEPGENRASQRVEVLDVAAPLLRLAPLGLDGFDALVLCDPDAQTCAEPSVTDAVLDWVALGGTLVVSLGEHAGQFSASPLAAEMPATWTGAGRTSYATLLADLCGNGHDADLPGPWTVLRRGATATPADAADDHDGAPIRVERRLGLGRIVLLPFDLRGVLMPTWIVKADARAILAPFVAVAAAGGPPDPNHWERVDYSTPVSRTLQAGAFRPPPLLLVVLGIIAYVVVVGPLDWFLLRRLKKERLTTLTFLGSVVAFTLLAYGASLLLFSSGPRVNRIVIADLVDAGRDGRQLLRTVDIAGFYSSTGADQDLAYAAPAVVLPASLPGFGFGGDMGSTLPVQVFSSDPLRPKAVVQLAFRSQRVVRVVSAGTIGPTIEVEWQDGGVRVVNGLPVDLDDVAVYTSDDKSWSLGPVASGATSIEVRFERGTTTRERGFEDASQYGWNDDRGPPVDVRRLLEAMTLGPSDPAVRTGAQAADAIASLRKAGINRAAAFGRKRALVVAHASKFPVALPGAEVEGDTHVVFRKEVDIP